MDFNIFESIWVSFNVFINIAIWTSPSPFHYNIFAMCIYLYIYFSLSTMSPLSTCFTTTLFFPVSNDPFQLSYNLWKYYTPILTFHTYTSPYILHSTFHVVIGCVEQSRAQVFYPNYFENFFKQFYNLKFKI
jgi:hypothetical protein